MKALMLILLAALSIAAPTVSGQSNFAYERHATETEAKWHVLQASFSGDLEAIAAHMASHGVVFDDPEKIRAYAKQALEEVDRAGRAAARNECKNRAELEKDEDSVIEAFDRLTAARASAIAAAVAALEKTLDNNDLLAFQHFVTHEGPVTPGVIDHAALIRAGGDYAEFIKRLCATEGE